MDRRQFAKLLGLGTAAVAIGATPAAIAKATPAPVVPIPPPVVAAPGVVGKNTLLELLPTLSEAMDIVGREMRSQMLTHHTEAHPE